MPVVRNIFGGLKVIAESMPTRQEKMRISPTHHRRGRSVSSVVSHVPQVLVLHASLPRYSLWCRVCQDIAGDRRSDLEFMQTEGINVEVICYLRGKTVCAKDAGCAGNKITVLAYKNKEL